MLYVDSGLLLSGLVTSTVMSIEMPGDLLTVRAPGLPQTVSPDRRFHPMTLEITVGDCESARGWSSVDRPFAITWTDEIGRWHMDRAGDSVPAMADTIVRFIEAVCDERSRP